MSLPTLMPQLPLSNCDGLEKTVGGVFGEPWWSSAQKNPD